MSRPGPLENAGGAIRVRWRLLTALWMLAILVGSLLPPNLGGRGGPGWHGVGYGVLVLLMATWQPPVVAASLAWVYGALMEGLQWLVRYRDAQVEDLVANAAAVIVGLVVWALARRRRR